MSNTNISAISHSKSIADSRHRGASTALDGRLTTEITPPSSIVHPEDHVDHREMPTHPVRVVVDLTTVSRWRPKQTQGANNAAAANALQVVLLEKNHKMVEHLLDFGVSPNHGSEASFLKSLLTPTTWRLCVCC
jgi:hypothetical protein